MDPNSFGPARTRQDRQNITPYSRNQPRKSLLSRVSDSLKDMLTPSWLSSLVSTEPVQKIGDVQPATALPTHLSSAHSDSSKYTSISPNTEKLQSSKQMPPSIDTNMSQQMKTTTNPLPSSSSSYQIPFKQQTYRLDMDANADRQTKRSADPLPNTSSDSMKLKKPRLLVEENLDDDSYLNKSSLNISSLANSFNQSMNGSILNSKDFSNSSYYPGKTVYGGMSSSKSLKLPTSSPYMRIEPSKKKDQQSNDKNPPALMPASRTAKRLLNTLNQIGFHSSVDKNSKNNDAFVPALYLRKKVSAPDSAVGSAKPTLNVPPVSSIQTLSFAKVIPTSYKPEIRNPQTESSLNSQSVVQAHSLPYDTSSGKMKKDKSYSLHTSMKNPEKEVLEIPNLSTAFTLPIKPDAVINIGTLKPFSSQTQANDVREFKFSQPSSASNGTKSSVSQESLTFTFSSPINADNKTLKIFNEIPKVMLAANGSKPLINGNKLSNSMTPEEKAPARLHEVHGNPPAKQSLPTGAADTLKSGTQAEKSNNSLNQPLPSIVPANTWGDLLKGQGTLEKWKCDTCLIQNNADKDTCVACGSKKANSNVTAGKCPPAAVSASNPPAITNTWGDLIKTQGGKWKCDACFVQNEASVETCVACQTKNPNSSKQSSNATASTSNPPAPTNTWGDIFKAQGGKWKCDACFVQNEASVETCVACQTKNPNSSKQSSSATATANTSGTVTKGQDKYASNSPDKNASVSQDLTGTSTAGWSNTLGSTSKLTADWTKTNAQVTSTSSSSWKCTTCLVSNPGNVSLCACCSACKPGTQSSLGEIGKGNQLPLYGIKFGGSAGESTPGSSKPFTFGLDNKTNALPSSSEIKPLTTGFSFNAFSSSASTQKDDSKTNTPLSGNAGTQVPISLNPSFPMAVPSDSSSVSVEQKKRKNEDQPSERITQSGSPAQKTDSQNLDIIGKSTSSLPALPKTSGFQFGVSKETGESSKPMFQFGTTGSSDIKKQTEASSGSSIPVFGASPAGSQSSKPAFSFGASGKASNENSKPEFSFLSQTSTANQQPSFSFSSGSKQDSSKPSFQFGAIKTEDASKSQASSESAPKSLFQFGTTQANNAPKLPSTENKPEFQVSAAKADTTLKQAEVPKAVFQFGAATTEPFPKPNTAVFGSNLVELPKASFQFGGTKSNETPVFQFGSSQPLNNQAQANTGSTIFKFGATSSDAKASLPSSANVNNPAGLFGQNSSSSASFKSPLESSSQTSALQFSGGSGAAPLFQFGKTSSTAGVFGSSAALPSGSDQSASKPSDAKLPSFGSSQAGFIFGNPGGGFGASGASPFQFGSQSTPNQSSAPTTSQTATSGYQFSSNIPVFQSAQLITQQASQPPAGEPGGFSMGTTNTNRVIKKAARRIQK